MRLLRIRNRYPLYGLMIATCLLMLGPWSCGRKAPPVPPKRPPLPQPTTLEGFMEDNRVRLTWRQGESGKGVAGYAVMRAQWPADQPPCDGCPLIFREVGKLTVEPDVEAFEFNDLVQTGQVYSYEVLPIGSTGDRGSASNRIVLPPEKVEE